jgi:cytochrome c oxidase cbb3-type subunit 3
MFSLCSSRAARLGLAVLLATPAAAMAQTAGDTPPAVGGSPNFVATSTLFPGGGTPPAPDPHVKLYQGNPQAIADGERLFEWYNCSGCHFHGGGGMGPALMDQQWIYGGKLDQIHASIVQGRPNGMPSWGRKIPDAQIWEIAAYVKSLSAPNPSEGAGQPMPPPPPPPEPKQ